MALPVPTVADPRTQQALSRIAQQFPLKTQHFAEEVITVNKIVEGTITGDRIEGGTLTGDLIAGGTIEGAHIASATITADLMDVNELSAISADLGTVTVGTLEGVLLRGSTLEGNTVKGTTVEGGTIVGSTIKTANSGARVELDSSGIRGINAGAEEKFEFDTATGILSATAVISAEDGSEIPTDVLAGQITETQIEDNAISTGKLAANSVTAAKLSVGELSAITANLGSITSGTITGATFRTSASDPKVQMDSGGLTAFDGEGEVLVGIPADGSDAFLRGGLAARGIDFASWDTASSPEPEYVIQWLSESDGSRTASISASDFVALSKRNQVLSLSANEEGDAEKGTAQIAAYNAEGQRAAVEMYAPSTSGSNAVAVRAGAVFKYILNGEGSDFLQIPEAAKRKINRGTTTLSHSGSGFYTGKTIAHGLGETCVVAHGEASDRVVNVVATPSGSTSIRLEAYTPFGSPPSSITAYWTAES